MTEITVPSSFLEPPTSEFPEGWYRGEIEGPGDGGDRIRDLADWDPPQQRLSIRFGSNEPIDGPDCGNRKLFLDVTVEAGGYDFDNYSGAPDNTRFALEAGLRTLTKLAVALEYATTNGVGEVTFDPAAFVQQYAAGEFDGQQVAFRTYHKTYASRADKEEAKRQGVPLSQAKKSRTDVRVAEFVPA